MAGRRWEREQGRRDATEDMSEDLSEGEKGDTMGELMSGDTPRGKKFQRNFSNLEVWSDDNKEKKLYIVLIRYSICNTTYTLYWIFRSSINFEPYNLLIMLLGSVSSYYSITKIREWLEVSSSIISSSV